MPPTSFVTAEFYMSNEAWVGLGTLIISVIGIIATVVWRASSIKTDLLVELQKNRLDIDEQFAVLRREVGETITAIRSKVTEVELYIRDNYVTKATFNVVLDRILAELKQISEKMENNKLRLETKIEEIRKTQD